MLYQQIVKAISSQQRRLLLVASVGFLWTLVCYFPAIDGPFFFDDEQFIEKNTLVHSLRHFFELYTTSVTHGSGLVSNFYRPNQQALFAFIYAFVGLETSAPYHLLSIALHAVNGILFLYWLRGLAFSLVASATAAAVFLFHPVQTEAVAYISGLSDPLALCFILAGISLYTNASLDKKSSNPAQSQSPAAFCMIVTFIIAATLSKEIGILLAPLLIVTTIFLKHTQKKGPTTWQVALCGTCSGLAAGYVVLKFTILTFTNSFGLSQAQNAYTTAIGLRLTTFTSVLWDYAVLIFYPKNLFYEKPYLAYADILTGRGVFGLTLICTSLFLIFTARRWPNLALAAAVFCLGLLPFSGVVPLNAMFLEHWLYVPMLGVGIAISTIVDKLNMQKHRYVYICVALILTGLASYRTRLRAGEWANPETFYLNEIEHGGRTVRIHNNLGMYYSDTNQPQRAIEQYQSAISIDQDRHFPQPHFNLSTVYLQTAHYSEAVDELHRTLQIDPHFFPALIRLRDFYTHFKDFPRVEKVEAAIASLQNKEPYDFLTLERHLF